MLTYFPQVVGRGGQAVLAFLAYRAFTKALVRHMETSSVSYEVFEMVTLRDITLSDLFTLCRDFAFNRNSGRNLLLLWIVISASFILAFPSLASAMTGYNVNTQAFVKGYSGQLIDFSDFKRVQGVIYDGWRVGLGGSYLITTDISFGKAASELISLTRYELTNPAYEIGLSPYNNCSFMQHLEYNRTELPYNIDLYCPMEFDVWKCKFLN